MYCCFRLQDRGSIQSLAAICFIGNALLMLLLFFFVINPEEATVILKLSEVDTRPQEVIYAPVIFIGTAYISSIANLFLMVGIEDNVIYAISVFNTWTSACFVLDAVAFAGIALWKVSWDNFAIFIKPLLFLLALGLFKVYSVQKLKEYTGSAPPFEPEIPQKETQHNHPRQQKGTTQGAVDDTRVTTTSGMQNSHLVQRTAALQPK